MGEVLTSWECQVNYCTVPFADVKNARGGGERRHRTRKNEVSFEQDKSSVEKHCLPYKILVAEASVM